jgi:hypothetical protein
MIIKTSRYGSELQCHRRLIAESSHLSTDPFTKICMNTNALSPECQLRYRMKHFYYDFALMLDTVKQYPSDND